MDRGIPTEEVLTKCVESDPPICYLVGTPKGRLSKLEAQLFGQPWKDVRPGLEVKLLAQEKELYILARSRQRLCKERAIRRRKLKKLWHRLAELRQMRLSRDQLLIRLGQAKEEAARLVWKLVQISVAQADNSPSQLLSYRLDKERLWVVRRREGRYLLRSNLIGIDPARLWELYVQLTQIEEAFRNLKGDLAIRPIYHQLQQRIEAHIFVAFIAYCLHVTLRRRLHKLAPGLTPRAVLEKFKTIQMIDVHLPTIDGRTVILPRYTQPEQEHRMLLHGLNLELPLSLNHELLLPANWPTNSAVVQTFSSRPLILRHLEMLTPRIGENGLARPRLRPARYRGSKVGWEWRRLGEAASLNRVLEK